MMNGRFVLDTNIVIALFAEDGSVQQHLTEADEVFVPSIVLGELYYGARGSRRTAANIDRIDELAAGSAVLLCDVETARKYGEIKKKLRDNGQRIPENDIWIAAVAKQYGFIIVSRDGHFSYIDGLSVVVW